jgi:hypothetical protein
VPASAQLQELPRTCRGVGTLGGFRSTKEGSMKAHGTQVLAAATLLAIVGFGCGEEKEAKGDHQIWFMGSVYDGATGQVVTGYEIWLVSGTTRIKGKVDDYTGRYTLGSLRAWNDYAIEIWAQDYRGFVSYNAGIAPPTRPTGAGGSSNTTVTADDIYSANTTQTFNFDAYVFPAGLQPAPIAVSIVKTDTSPTPPDGSIRLRPISLPSIQEQTAGVGTQVWANDQDILAAVINSDFVGGSIVIPSEQLVYGVNYSVQVYNVPGYQPTTTTTTPTTTVRAGFQESLTMNIVTTAGPLFMTGNTIMQCRPGGQSTNVQRTAQIVFTFNATSIEDATPITTSQGRGPEVLDAGLQVVTSLNTPLKPNLMATAQERATQFVPNGNTLSIGWDPSVGLNSLVSGDTITSVTYTNLGSIKLQPTGHPELAKTLAEMLPGMATSIYCGN